MSERENLGKALLSVASELFAVQARQAEIEAQEIVYESDQHPLLKEGVSLVQLQHLIENGKVPNMEMYSQTAISRKGNRTSGRSCPLARSQPRTQGIASLDRARIGKSETNNGGSMSQPLPISTLKQIIFGDDLELDTSDPDKPDDNPFPEMILRNQVAAALKSSSGASVVLDMSVPSDDVDSDDSEFWKAPRIVRYDPNAKTSGAAFVKVLATIRRVFDGHPEEMDAAIEIVEKIRADIRAEILAAQ